MELPGDRLLAIECKARVFYAAMYSLGDSGIGVHSEMEAKAFQQFAKEICSEIAEVRKQLSENWTIARKGADIDSGSRLNSDRSSNIFSQYSGTPGKGSME